MTPEDRSSPTAPQPRSEDAARAEACARGDLAVFEEIYRQHGDRMKSVAYNHLGNVSDAEDAVQEVFLKLHRSAGTYNGSSSFVTWMYRILINTCYDMLRRRRRRIEETRMDDMFDVGGGPEADAGLRMTLRKLLGRLPEQKRSVFLLFEVEGLSHAEIASILGIKENYSKWLLFSTRQELQKMWVEKGRSAV